MIEKCISFKRDSNTISSISKYDFDGNKTVKTTMYYSGLSTGADKRTMQKKYNFGDIKPLTAAEKVMREQFLSSRLYPEPSSAGTAKTSSRSRTVTFIVQG